LFIVALSPIIWLIIALSLLKISSHKACPIALLVASIAALFAYNMPLLNAATAILEGVALACWPILLVIIAAIFTYNLSIHTKSMDTIKEMLTSVSTDRRILVLLIAWGFGAFLEGMAGFGTAIAIPASMLVGIGINPLLAALVCLIANSVPTAYGSIGIPLVTLGQITGIAPLQLAKYVSFQLAPLNLLCPFLIVMVTGRSIRALKGVFGLTLVAGLSFLLPEMLVSFLIGPELAVVAASICTMTAIVLYAKAAKVSDAAYKMDISPISVPFKKGALACLPFILIFIFLLITSKLIPAINQPLNLIKTSVLIYSGSDAAPYTFTWLATPGILILLASFIGGRVQSASFSEMFHVLFKTIISLRNTIITIITVIATAKIMGYSGMTNEIAETAVNTTGVFYPIIAPFIGSVGTFITGSATSSSVLFGKLQTASATAIYSNAIWLAASNATGACAGKMISPQSIAIATAAISVTGRDSELLKAVAKYYVFFIVFMGCIVYFGQTLLQ
jgi:lactate permease